MFGSPRLDQLLEALRRLPGVGPKTAQRMAIHLLERDRKGALKIAHALQEAIDHVGHCQQCNIFSESDLCTTCASPRRDARQLCVVETPADWLAIENSGVFSGKYYVLMGRLSPLDGIGPQELGLDKLRQRMADGVEEIIIATNPTMEGEATAHYISQMARSLGLKATRIAHGIPMGGELEFVDSGTLMHAFNARKLLTEE